MAARGNTIAQGFSGRVMEWVYEKSVLQSIANSDYEGEINGVGSRLNILDFDEIEEKDYNNAAMSADDLSENNGYLEITKKKAFYFKIKDYENWLSYIKDPKKAVFPQTAGKRLRNMDIFALGFYGDVAAGNRVGTDYTIGTVTVAATTGVVTGSGTTFTSTMVGRGFKATGHTKWYRVKTFNSVTEIVIEDDKDDITSAYTGGAINAGAAYTIEAATPKAITTTNLLEYIAALKTKLDTAEANGHPAVPDEDRWLVVPAEFENLIVRAQGVALHVPEVYQNLVGQGMIGTLLGFKIFKSSRLTGNNTDGYRVLAGHPNWLTFAEKVLKARVEEDLTGDFGEAYKDLFVYGAKVKDIRRGFAAEGYFTFTIS